jgi:hypothetical protein
LPDQLEGKMLLRSKTALGLGAAAFAALALSSASVFADGGGGNGDGNGNNNGGQNDKGNKGEPSLSSIRVIKSRSHRGTVTVRVTTNDFRFGVVGTANKSGRGHEHFSMDRGHYDYPRYSGANGKLAKRLGTQGRFSPSMNNRVIYRHLKRGRHTVVVHLVRNDQTNYANRSATRRASFRVR